MDEALEQLYLQPIEELLREAKKPKDPIDVITNYIKDLERENSYVRSENSRLLDALVRIMSLSPDIWTRQYADYVLASIAEDRGG